LNIHTRRNWNLESAACHVQRASTARSRRRHPSPAGAASGLSSPFLKSFRRIGRQASWYLTLSICNICLVLASMSSALAAPLEAAPREPSQALFIAQIVLLLLVSRLLGEVMQRIGQPGVMGQLVAGVVLRPSLFGAIWPDAHHARRRPFLTIPSVQSPSFQLTGCPL
jgi:hypothetical protein